MEKKNIPFGAMAIALGYATNDQILEALEAQQKLLAQGKKSMPLGAMLVKMRVISSDQLMEILNESKKHSLPINHDSYQLASRLRTQLEHESSKMMLFTGIETQDAHSNVLAQIGIALAVMEPGRILLVDANYRSSSLSGILGFKKDSDAVKCGLTEYINGDATAEEAVKKTQIPNLFHLPTGNRAVDSTGLSFSPE